MSMDFINQLDEMRRPKIEPKPWMKEVRMELVTPDNLKRVIDECIAAGRYGLDLETTGLNNNVFDGKTVDQIVGVCLAPNPNTGYYIPLRHSKGMESPPSSHFNLNTTGPVLVRCANIPLSVFDPEFTRLMDSDSVAVFHNAIFDQEFLEFNGTGKPWGNWDLVTRWDDTMFLMYLSDSRSRQRGLKYLSKTFLGREMFELDELFPKDHKGGKDFASLDPFEELTLWYASSDAMCTLGLYDFLAPKVLGPGMQASIYTLEKKAILATRWMQRNRIMIDRKKVAELIQIAQREWFASLKELYEAVSEKLGRDIKPIYFYLLEREVAGNSDFEIRDDGSMGMLEMVEVCRRRAQDPAFLRDEQLFNLSQRKPNGKFPVEYDAKSPQQLGTMFDELGVPGLTYTEKSKQVKTSKDELDRIVEENEDLPYIGKVKKFREVEKALTSYLLPMWEDTQKDGSVRANYKQDGTDTGRYSVKVSKDPKMDGGCRWPVHGTPNTAKKSLPECARRVRECVVAREGMEIIAADFGGVELRIVTNLSHEPLWVNEFFRCGDCGHTFKQAAPGEVPEAPPPFCPSCGSDSIGDLHTLTAQALFGSDVRSRPDFKEMRGKAKCVHPDTLIGVGPEGLRRIGDFIYGGVDVFLKATPETQVWADGQMVPVKNTYNGGTKPLYHVVTRRGILTCSPEHRFQMQDGSLKSVSSGLEVGDLVAEAVVPTLSGRGNWPYLGSVPGVEGIQTNDIYAYFAGYLLSHSEAPDPEYWLLQTLGMLSPDKHLIHRVPKWVLEAGEAGARHFLPGLFGNVGLNQAVYWSTQDAVFAGQVAALCQVVGKKVFVKVVHSRLGYYYVLTTLENEDGPNTILEIVPAGYGPCVDLSLNSKSHLYWTNGLLTHNSTNFALCYGGGGKAVVHAAKVDENEGWRIKHKFDATYKTLKQWWDAQHAYGRQHGYVRTAFGRWYPVPDINLPKIDKTTGLTNGGLISQAERNACNSPVQGTSADVTKLAMGMIYLVVKKNNWMGKVNLLITMHDELVFEISHDILEEAVLKIEQLMIRNSVLLKMPWAIPLTVDTEFGHDWTVKYDLKNYRTGKKPWPEEIKPWFPKLVAATSPASASQTSPDQVVIETAPSGVGAEPSTSTPVEGSPSLAAIVSETSSVTQIPAFASDSEVNGEHHHIIRGILTAEKAGRYGRVIRSCHGNGKTRLRLFLPSGQELTWNPDPVYVNSSQFYWLAHENKLA